MRRVCALVLAVGSAHALAAEPEIRCRVCEAGKPATEARDFMPSVAQAALGKGLLATAATSALKRGRRTDVTIEDRTGAEREIAIEVLVTAPGRWSRVFATDGRGPRRLQEAGSVRYRSQCSLPAVTFLGADEGLTVAAAFEVPAPVLTFSWRREAESLWVVATVANLRLPAHGSAKASIVVGTHQACWRPGLGWLVELYPQYFHPPNPGVFDYDGPMIYDFVTSEDRLRRDLEQGLSWQELGWYWPHLGLYLPEGESWPRQPRTEGGLGTGGVVTRKMLRDYIALSNRLGLAQCLYFQSTESWAEYAERHFPQSRYRNASGDLAPTWVKCTVMNPSPEGRFGKHILAQLQGLVEAFPGMAGVFWDQNCYTGFDFAHDDGVSMVRGRRVSMMELPQNRLLALGSKILHDRGKVIFTNGGWTAGLARYCDGHMSEGTRPTRRLQYICMMKHLTLLAYDHNVRAGREKLLLALETGAQPSVTLGDDACRALFRGYKPIFRLLRHKQWVFHPQALALPEGFAGNIFRNPDGHYVVTVVEQDDRRATPAEKEKPATVEIRIPDAKEFAHVFELNPRLRGLQATDAKRREDGFTIAVPRPAAGTALLLPRRGRWIASGTPRLVAGSRQTVSVVLANLEPEPWQGLWHLKAGGLETARRVSVGPGQIERVPIGPLPVPDSVEPFPVSVEGPSPAGGTEETRIDLPVVSAIGLRLPQEQIVQVLKGEAVPFAVGSRLADDVVVAVRSHWKGSKAAAPTAKLPLKPGEVRALSVRADLPRGGLWELQVEVQWPSGRVARSQRVDVVTATLPREFKIDDVTAMTLRMDVFNSLGKQWADKPVEINGVAAGPLPITGCTLRWHEGLNVEIAAGPARKMLAAGLQKDGGIELRPRVQNRVKNCFKVRNVQATIRVRSGEKFLSSWTRAVHCSDAGWLYSEGECVHMTQPVPLGCVRFIREQ